jgi:hypothetical protein
LIDNRPIVDGDSRLQMRDVDESRTQIVAETFQIFRPLTDCARGPTFQPPKNENAGGDNDQYNENKREGP